MAELGALSLRIEETGGDQVLRQVKALDASAKQAGVSLDAAAKVLTKLGISAKVVGGQIQVAEGQTAKAAAIVQRLGVTAQVTTGQEQQLAQATQRVAQSQQQMAGTTAAATGRMTLFGREVVNSTGRLSSFAMRGITGLNATAFALSTLASGGQASFRTLAASAASFAAFFGPGGAIASIALTGGLAIADFFVRTRAEIEDTKEKAKLALNELIQAGNQRFRADQPVLTAQLAEAQQRAAVARIEADIAKKNQQIQKPGAGLAVATLIGERTKLEAELAKANFGLIEAQRQVADAFKSAGEAAANASDVEVAALAKVIEAGKATNAERQQAAIYIDRARFALAQLNSQNRIDAAATVQRAALLNRIKTLTDAFTKSGGDATDAVKKAAEAEQKRRDAIAKTVDAIVTLQKLDRQTGQDLVALIALEGQLTDELARGNTTRERRAEIETQLAKLRGAALVAPVVRQPLGGGAVGPAQRIEVPASIQTQLDPSRIQADMQRMDALVAERARAFNFQTLSETLAQSLGNALAAGIAGGFVQGLAQGGIGEGFQQMTAQMLQGLGNAAISFALASQEISALMQTIAESLASLNPWVALAAGVALAALGAKLGGAARSSFGGGTISSVGRLGGNPTPLNIRRLIVDPNAERAGGTLPRIGTNGLGDGPPVQVVQVIGINTPRGQELIGTANQRFIRRGG